MHKLMIKKDDTTWEIPLLKDKLGGVTLCVKVSGETFYAPTLKDGEALKGCGETPLVFMKNGEKYRVCSIREYFFENKIVKLGYVCWNKSSRDLIECFYEYYKIDSEERHSLRRCSNNIIIPHNTIIRPIVIKGNLVIQDLTTGKEIFTMKKPYAKYGICLSSPY